MKSQKTTKVEIFVSGRVQGVGFRRYTQKTAAKQGLIGTVRNLLDGRVHIVVQGDEKTVEEFCEKMKQGPPFAQVEDLKVGLSHETLTIQEFLIIPDGDSV